jgi:hypothetical protein
MPGVVRLLGQSVVGWDTERMSLPLGWTGAGVLAVVTAAATVGTAVLAVIALRAIVSDRRALFELERLHEMRLALEQRTLRNSWVREPLVTNLLFLDASALPFTRQVCTAIQGGRTRGRLSTAYPALMRLTKGRRLRDRETSHGASRHPSPKWMPLSPTASAVVRARGSVSGRPWVPMHPFREGVRALPRDAAPPQTTGPFQTHAIRHVLEPDGGMTGWPQRTLSAADEGVARWLRAVATPVRYGDTGSLKRVAVTTSAHRLDEVECPTLRQRPAGAGSQSTCSTSWG